MNARVLETALERSFQIFRELVAADPTLSAELVSSAAEFFRGGPPPTDPAGLAHLRHFEWFLLERPSALATGSGLALDQLADDWRKRAEGDPLLDPVISAGRDVPADLSVSHAGVFEVTGIEDDQGAWLKDLAGFGEYPILEPSAAQHLEAGDLIVGRLFPADGSFFIASRGAAVFRDQRLVEALRADLERARAGRRGVLRISQSELEAMFWQSAGNTEVSLADARAVLIEGGLEPADCDAIFETLAASPPDPANVLPGTGDALGMILERLAFETEIDLERARRTLLHAWSELAQGPRTPQAPARAATKPPHNGTVDVDVAGAVEAFERGRAEGRDIDTLFRELEDTLQLDTDSEADDDADLPDFPGVVSAMIDEFLWERGLEVGEREAQSLAGIKSLGASASEVGVFENLAVRHLLAYACHWLPESGELEGDDEVQARLDALRQFCKWSEETHDVPLWTDFADALQGLERSLPRIVRANAQRSDAVSKTAGDLFEVLESDESGAVSVQSASGSELRLAVEPGIARHLDEGDRLRGELVGDAELRVFCCYPPEIEGLVRSSE